jgi:hypothetical protein
VLGPCKNSLRPRSIHPSSYSRERDLTDRRKQVPKQRDRECCD